VQFEQPLGTGTRVCLMLGRHKFRGQVTHCTYEKIGYFVGIRFDAGKVWSRKVYEPKHLLDPRQVAAAPVYVQDERLKVGRPSCGGSRKRAA